MNNSNFFRDIFSSIPDYRKIGLSIFLIKNNKNLLVEIGFSERDINRLNVEFKDILLKQHENYLDYVKDQEKSVIEKILKIKLKMILIVQVFCRQF